MKAHMDVREGESDMDVRPSRHSEQPMGPRPSEAGLQDFRTAAKAIDRKNHLGATYPPGTPRGDSTTCHNWIRRARNAAIDAAR